MQEVLVTHASGAGVVRRDDGWVMVTGNIDDGAATGIRREDRYHPAKSWVDAERSVVGGWLPPGAVAAEVVDDRGRRVVAEVANGAYVAVIDQPNDGFEAIVCSRDPSGQPVRRPRAAQYPSVRVTDAAEPCPACGAIDWDEYQPFEQWRGGSGSKVDGSMVANPVVSCRVCGHEEAEGSFFGMPSAIDETEDNATREARLAEVRARIRRQQWESGVKTLRATSFTPYAVDGWSPRMAGHSSQDGEVTEVTVHHDRRPHLQADPLSGERSQLIVITNHDTRFRKAPLQAAREALERQIRNRAAGDGEGWPDASRAAITLYLNALDRRSRGAVLAAERSEQPITLDGVPTPAVVLTALDNGWAAAAHHGDLLITVASLEDDPRHLRLGPIADPVATLLGTEPPDP